MDREIQKRGESLRKARTAATILQGFCIVLLVGLIYLFAHSVQRYALYQDSIREDALWHANQLDRAARRLHEAIALSTATGDVGETKLQEISESFDILYSQVDVMNGSIFGRDYLADKVSTEIGVVRRWVADNTPIFDGIANGDKPSVPDLERMRSEVNGLLDATTDLLALTVTRVQSSRAEARMTIFEAQLRTGIVVSLLVVSVTVLVFLLRRQLREMGQAGVELEAISDELRAANRKLSDKASWLRSEVDKALAEVRDRDIEIVDRLSLAADYKDAELGAHTRRVGAYSEAIARHMGLCDEICADIRLASPMHDIGKVAIPDSVLLKAGPLTDAEFAIMQKHTVIGSQILSESKSALLRLAAEIAEHHHEYWNGKGYPNSASGTEIPLSARIVAVADTFDALTTIRPYKEAWSSEQAIEYIVGRADEQFDPACIVAFQKALGEILAIMNEEMTAVVA
ncbi:Cyclic di-GMP phosphodiesterase response regulator RpfG [compost metagenome]